MTSAPQPTPAIPPGPSEKERKYDRQLRLWAASGQRALESAHILLLNSGSGYVGIEVLKNLVLPGIGRFTIVDPEIVTESDLGINFFLDHDRLGEPRGAACTEYLLELNPEVQGNWHPKIGETYHLENLLDMLPPITLILCALPAKPAELKIVREYARKFHMPVATVHSAGLYSYFHLELPEPLTIVETHPEESATLDLRLLHPWPELLDFAREITADISQLDDHDHGHIPFVALLLHYLEEWTSSHRGRPPSKPSEKGEFKRMVQAGMRQNTPAGEENFEEAISMIRRILQEPTLPSSAEDIFEYLKHLESRENHFWVIAEAVKGFYDTNGCLPVTGSLPDMKAKSDVYVRLQNIYKKKAREDAVVVFEKIKESGHGEGIAFADVELFCKNAAFVALVRPSPCGAENLRQTTERILEEDKMASEAGLPLSLLPAYLALHATAHMQRATQDEILENISRIVPDAARSERLVQAAAEVSRASGAELHNISAATGGLVAQELIKIVTRQYVPVDNTCIYDGSTSRCQVFRI